MDIKLTCFLALFGSIIALSHLSADSLTRAARQIVRRTRRQDAIR